MLTNVCRKICNKLSLMSVNKLAKIPVIFLINLIILNKTVILPRLLLLQTTFSKLLLVPKNAPLQVEIIFITILSMVLNINSNFLKTLSKVSNNFLADIIAKNFLIWASFSTNTITIIIVIILLTSISNQIKKRLYMMMILILQSFNLIYIVSILLILLMMNSNSSPNFIIWNILTNSFMSMMKMTEDVPCFLTITIKLVKLPLMEGIGICKVVFNLLNKELEIILSTSSILL